MAITFRNSKGSPLSHSEMDQNFGQMYITASVVRNFITLTSTGTGSLAQKNDVIEINTGSITAGPGIEESAAYEFGLRSSSLFENGGVLRWNNTKKSLENSLIIDDGTTVYVRGNIEVIGTQSVIDTNTINIGDNILSINGSGAANGGIEVNDTASPNFTSGSLIWKGLDDSWFAGPKGSEGLVLTSANVSGALAFDTDTSVARIVSNSIVLGSSTSGSYVASLVAGNGISLANNSGEDAKPTVSLSGTYNGNYTLTGSLTATAQGALVSKHPNGYIQIGPSTSTLTSYFGQIGGSSRAYIEVVDSNSSFDEQFKVTVGSSDLFFVSKAGQSDTATDAVEVKNADFSVDYKTLYVNSTTNKVGINQISPAEALDVIGKIKATDTVTAANFITTSDRNIKSDIKNIEDGLSVLKKVLPYTYVKDGKQDAGWIAQDAQKELPYSVTKSSEGILAMNDRPLLAHMHQAILDIEKRLQAIEEKIK